MKIMQAPTAALMFFLGFFAIFPASSQAYIFKKTDSDYLFINGTKTTILEVDPPACGTNCETSLTLGAFDKAVIATEGAPVVTSPSPGLFTVHDVSDVISQKAGVVSFSSAPDCIGFCTITFGFDPRGVIPLINEFENRDIYVTDMLFDAADPNRKIVNFQSDPEPVLRRAKPELNKAESGGSTLTFTAATEILSFSGHHLIDTGFAGDPILGADVLIPDYRGVTGTEDGTVIFIARTDPTFEISLGGNVYLRAKLTLDYHSDDNTFFGQLSDLAFSNLGSPWIAAMADLFDPASVNFDPSRNLYFTYAPRDNFLDLTQSFTVDAISGGGDSLFAARAAPEPGVPVLFAIGLVGVGFTRSRCPRAKKRMPCRRGMTART